jgi:hypothetical protein
MQDSRPNSGLACAWNTQWLLSGLANVLQHSDCMLVALYSALASKGNLQTETLRAFTEDEYRKIVSGLK